MAETRIRTGRTGAAEPGGRFSGLRRGRHRKPRPRRALLAAGGLLLAAGVLSLVRMTPESGVGAPGTAAAEPRLDPGGGLANGGPGPGASGIGGRTATTTDGTLTPGPLAPPSTAADLGGRTPAPTPTGAATTPGNPGGSGSSKGSGESGGSAGSDGGVPPAPGKSGAPTARPGPTAPNPAPPVPISHPAPPTAPAPTPTHGAPAPAPGGLCLPIIALCVDVGVLGGHGG
ncbi:hypothetical protein [Streptomyces sp. LaBMicrA B280]|uniref:hypothetical protein n=1 Tax=Streptomyces sp. LaBMicrA B280 TaxID=3391001 RepID=UPI003BA7DC07